MVTMRDDSPDLLDSIELPVHVDRTEYEDASPQERAEFELNHRQLKECGYVGHGARAAQPVFVIDLSQFAGFSDYIAQCRKTSRSAVHDIARARRRGYYSAFFNPRNHLDDMPAIAESAPVRQGRRLPDGFFLSPEGQGGYPASVEPEGAPGGAIGWERHFGVFRSNPGHRQGPLVVDEELVGYAHLRRYANAIWVNRFIGH
jgi:hypothetical protein